MKLTKAALERVYRRYNRRSMVHPDPLEFLYPYDDPLDREVVGFVAASLAYGRVAQILASVSRVLAVLGPSPARALSELAPDRLEAALGGFVHRFATGPKLCGLLTGIGRALETHGSLCRCFRSHLNPGDATVVQAAAGFAEEILQGAGKDPGHLLPLPSRGSACKRLHLFFRWMVRADAVDPGLWQGVSPSQLVIPLDVHMHRIGRLAGFTRRSGTDLPAALEITEGFRRLAPQDPVRYDFALTRIGMRGDSEFREVFET